LAALAKPLVGATSDLPAAPASQWCGALPMLSCTAAASAHTQDSAEPCLL